MRLANTRTSEHEDSALWQAAESLCSNHRTEKMLYSDFGEMETLCSEL